jgi:Holliday junction resolvase RusA-like endonuclease
VRHARKIGFSERMMQGTEVAPHEALGTSLELSRLPPSTNRLFFNRPGKGRTKTLSYRDWRASEGWGLIAQKISPVPGPIVLRLRLPDRPGRSPDIDNVLKAIIDLLVSQRIIEADDKRILRALSVEWDKGITCIQVSIRPISDKVSEPGECV